MNYLFHGTVNKNVLNVVPLNCIYLSACKLPLSHPKMLLIQNRNSVVVRSVALME